MSAAVAPAWFHSEAHARYLLRRGVDLYQVADLTQISAATVERIAQGEPERVRIRRALKRLAIGADAIADVMEVCNLPEKTVYELSRRLQVARAMLSAGKSPESIARALKIRLTAINRL